MFSTPELSIQSFASSADEFTNIPVSLDPSKSFEEEEIENSSGVVTGTIDRSVSSTGVGRSHIYDKFGNLTSDAINNGRTAIESKYTYTANGNLLSSFTDPLDSKTIYNFNSNMSILTSVTDPNGKVTNYTYSTNQPTAFPISVSKNVSGLVGGSAMSNSYTYDGDKLKTVSHNGFGYTFDYNSDGTLMNVKVGTQDLITNTLITSGTPTKKKRIGKTLFGNGQSWTYYYSASGANNTDSVTEKRLGNSSANSYEFNYDFETGQLNRKVDYIAGKPNTETRYNGNTVELWKWNGPLLLHSYTMEGDRFHETIRSNTMTYVYLTDDEGRPLGTSYSYAPNKTVFTETRSGQPRC